MLVVHFTFERSQETPKRMDLPMFVNMCMNFGEFIHAIIGEAN